MRSGENGTGGTVWRKLLTCAFWLVNAWAFLCLASFVSGFLITLAGAPRSVPLPWSDIASFAESADGRIFVDLAFFSRVVCLDRDGSFLASLPYPGGAAKATELAASADGRVFHMAAGRIYELDSSWQLQRQHHGGEPGGRDWTLDVDGQLVPAADGRPASPVVDRLAQPGDRIFSSSSRRRRFACRDGSFLVRKFNHLERISNSGELIRTYAAPVALRPFTFPLPAVLAWPYLFVVGAVRGSRRKRRGATNHSE
jgi:hypothetical protein